jgi:antibiotic biosynthesis monooxygenase (ABM) superfamily enzyme
VSAEGHEVSAAALAIVSHCQRSEAATALLREADAVSAAGPSSQVRSGLETWFTLPGVPMPAKPPANWKMAIVTWVALLPLVIALAYIFAPFRLPFLVEVSLSTAIPVSLLTWVVMPALTRLLYRWLYPETRT